MDTIDPPLLWSAYTVLGLPLSYGLGLLTANGYLYKSYVVENETSLQLLVRLLRFGLKIAAIGPLFMYVTAYSLPASLGLDALQRSIAVGVMRSLSAAIIFNKAKSIGHYIKETPNYIIAGALEGILNAQVKPYIKGFGGPNEEYYLSSIPRHIAKPVFENIDLYGIKI